MFSLSSSVDGVKEASDGSREDLLRTKREKASRDRGGHSLPGALGHASGFWLLSIIVKVSLVRAMVFPGV